MSDNFELKVKEEVTLKIESGEEIKMKLLLTFEDKENNDKYAFYFDEEERTQEVFPFLYDEENDELMELESEKQWKMAEEILSAFLENEDSENK